MSSPSSATSMLDKLLARSATLQKKLDRMTTSQPGRARAGEVFEAVGTNGPSAMLDRCVTRTNALNSKVDKLSTDVAASRLISDLETTTPRTRPGFQNAPKQQVQVRKLTITDIAQNSPAGCTKEGELWINPTGCGSIMDPNERGQALGDPR